MIKLLRILIFSLLCMPAVAGNLQSLEIKELNGRTIVSFKLSAPFSYNAFSLKSPSRVVVDFANTITKINLEQLKTRPVFINGIRQSGNASNNLRIVFDLNHSVPYTVAKKGTKLELSFAGKALRSSSSKPAKQTVQIKSIKKNPVALRDVVVVLDPGHGGKDPGAIGSNRHREKDVVLAIAQKLKKIIDKEPGMKAVLTRNGNYYVGLRERLNIARKFDGDVFISIHADAYINRDSNGVSVFAVSQNGATSEAARWLAEKENYSELGGVNLAQLDDQNDLIRTVLIDLSQTATIGASLQMGTKVLQDLNKISNLHHAKVEQARFVVLKSPDIPSILIETGFISNPREERNLISSAYQMKLSQAIFAGVKRYFFQHPPHNTHIEAMSGLSKHLVQKGDSLSKIASRYHTSVAVLKELNHLNADGLKAGKSLSIPRSWA